MDAIADCVASESVSEYSTSQVNSVGSADGVGFGVAEGDGVGDGVGADSAVGDGVVVAGRTGVRPEPDR